MIGEVDDELADRQSNLTIHATILVLALIPLGRGELACAQGVATGGTAVPARPLPPGMKAPAVSYEDLAVQAGLIGVEVSGADHGKQYIVESTGTGVAIFDYDNDGLPDILLVNGGRLGDGAQPKPFLYHNLGGVKFEDVTEKAGITSTGWGQGICAGDIDNDGNTDVFVTQVGTEYPVPESGEWHVSRRDQRTRSARVQALEHRLRLHRL